MPIVPRRWCLIVEDELLIGMDLEEAVRSVGFEPLWAASLASAMSSLQHRRPDIAIVDITLRDGSCVDLVRELKREAVPFVVHSASAAADGPPDLAGVPWLTKPAAWPAILDALGLVVPGPAAGSSAGPRSEIVRF